MQKNIHAILLEELEAESGSWISTPEDMDAKITDDLWATPGNNSAGGQITMPDEHLWRFSSDIGLYNQEEEVGPAQSTDIFSSSVPHTLDNNQAFLVVASVWDETVKTGKLFHTQKILSIYIITIKMHSSCEIEYFVETHLCKVCVILGSRVLRVVCPH